jgi:hypothetical protein
VPVLVSVRDGVGEVVVGAVQVGVTALEGVITEVLAGDTAAEMVCVQVVPGELVTREVMPGVPAAGQYVCYM